MKKLHVAAIGAGYFSQFHYDAWSRMDDVELVAICNRDKVKAGEFAARWSIPAVYGDPAEMLDREKPDLVDIITPPETHLRCISLVAERGLAAICQKAFCTSFEEAERAAALVEEAGVTVVVHENFRFQPWYGRVREMIDAGEFGEIYQATFRLRPGDGQGPDAYLDRQPYFQQMPRFLVHETAIHFVDTFRFLFGEVDRVYADLRRLNPAIAGEDAGLILFDHRSGVRSLFDGNRLSDHAAHNRRLTMGEMLIEGSRGTATLDGDGGLRWRSHGRRRGRKIDYDWRNAGFGGDCVYRLQRAMVRHLRGQGPATNLVRDYLTNLRVERMIYESAEAGTIRHVME